MTSKKPAVKNKKTTSIALPHHVVAPPAIHHHYYPSKPKHFNFGKLSFGLFLIIVGLLYLAKNLGWLNLEFNLDLWRLWPLLIVFAGLSMLTSRNLASIFAGIVLTLTVLTITLIVILGPTDYSINLITTDKNKSNGNQINWLTTPLSLEADLATQTAVFHIKSNLNELALSGGSSRLLEGELQSDFATALLDNKTTNSESTVNLEIKPKISLFKGQLSQTAINLNNQLASKIYLDSLASTVNFKLAGLSSESIIIDAAASSITLDFNAYAGQDVKITAKASEVNLIPPTDLNLKLKLKNPQDIKSHLLEKIDNLTYQILSQNQTNEYITVNLDLAASDINIK